MIENKYIYVYYDKDTKIYKGTEFKINNSKYQNCEFIKKDFEDWKSFLDTNPYIIKIIDGDLIKEDRVISIEEEKDTVIGMRKYYLSSTDWIITKINELNVIGESIEGLLTKYSNELTKRTLARTQINEIELVENIEDLEQYKVF